MYLRLLTILLLTTGLRTMAQMIPVTHFTSREAVYAERINCMTQDNKGYMWFGTYFGIMRYDGYEWKKIELPEEMRNRFVATMAASGDTIYAGIYFGGGFLEWQNGKSRRISLPDPYNLVTKTTRKKDGNITLVLFSENTPLSQAIYNYRQDQFSPLWKMDLKYQNINDIQWDNDQNLWIGTSTALLIRSKNGSVKEKLPGIHVIMILVNEDGTKLVGGTREGKTILYYFDNRGELVGQKTSTGILNVYGNNEEGMWTYQKDKGLVYYDKNLNEFSYPFNIAPGTVMGCIFIDREKNIWLSSEAGLFRFSQINVRSFQFLQKGPSSGYINRIEGGSILTNGTHLYFFDGNALSPVNSLKKTGNIGSGYTDMQGNTWLLQWGDENSGIWKTLWRKSQLIRSSYINKYKGRLLHPSDLKQLKDSSFFVAGHDLFVMMQDKITQHYPVRIDGKPVQVIKLCPDEKRNIIWLGTNGKGILKLAYHKTKNGYYAFSTIDRIHSGNGLKDDFIRGGMMLDKKGRLWVGSRNAGLSCIEEKAGGYRITNIGEKAGMGCVRINSILEYGDDIWTSSCDGIYQLREMKIIRKYYSGDGLIGNDVHQFNLNNDTLLAVTSDGFTQLKLVASPAIRPSVTISEINVMGKINSYPNTSRLNLPEDRNAIGFEFTANSFIDEKAVMYRYMLEGYDKQWSEPVSANKINYASLRAGNYTFKVIAKNATGAWSPDPATFSFRIVLPFYKTATFYVIVFLILMIIITAIVFYRRENRRKLEKVRMTIARDLHDDIGSALGSINILSRTAQRKIRDDKEAEAVVNKIGLTAQKTLESMDEIIWTINPVKEKAIDLVIRMQNFAQPLLEGEGIEFHFSTNFPEGQKLNMELKRNLYLIFKELVYNAIKHSDCKNVFVSLNSKAGELELNVEDDGNGVSVQTAETVRNGLSNIRARASLLKGKFILTNREPQGTIARLTIPAE